LEIGSLEIGPEVLPNFIKEILKPEQNRTEQNRGSSKPKERKKKLKRWTRGSLEK
jgi:hypothetical protein